jgi:hypothetical protein
VEALIALGGVALGWLLGLGSAVLRDRRQARIAAHMIQVELMMNQAELRRLRQIGFWGGAPEGPRRTAWEAHAGNLIPAADARTMDLLVRSYTAFDRVAAILAVINAPLEPGEDPEETREAIHNKLKGERAAVIDRTIEELDEAMVRLAVLGQARYRLRIARMLLWYHDRRAGSLQEDRSPSASSIDPPKDIAS